MSDWNSTCVGMASLQKIALPWSYLRLAPPELSASIFKPVPCPRLVKKCYFTIPFEGLDPRVSKQKKVEFDRLVLSPPPSPSIGVGIIYIYTYTHICIYVEFLITSIQYCLDLYLYMYLFIYYYSLICFVFFVIHHYYWIYHFSRSKGYSYLFWNL